ncbi:hypothetical protein BATDEDRAFT_90199 [Batrachochytrium dendrobatidis JAM81]|uniref:Nucleolar 27S pre-rRNA processing Urb2/Npa2 C-terminal domain-containing protein n=1 Tax=Batrachochytrium dendrobatidis (strain JAM81 / FGSC 10211) TaxID=684364 RepID=F4P756_BATDJ|nr:uncharacterized protein BATDEDRAFT_90199 [Batrachochytrium dendrobatidis JAM81]EGF79022.1 hypothetical protein BATDEDRAFT_90199 [Batrachochytrium dendrobatidis JAM81]KAK5667518.1 hypothetical protein QVD99_006106 [Batrachochytrium dendrobatidis]|eukprot:XP_006680544.1 hypothetical protein BATDEDRAFT_90199 [Batrachochytrium dendrobatidis JAM81]
MKAQTDATSTSTVFIDAIVSVDSSLQSITQALRNNSIPFSQRLKLAISLWHSHKVFLPGKTELLLDWISSLLVKSIVSNADAVNESANLSKTSDQVLPYLSLDGWTFFLDILKHIDVQKKQDLALKQSLFLQLKVPLSPLFSALVSLSAHQISATVQPDLIISVANQVFRLATTSLADIAAISVDQLSQLSIDVLQTLLTRANASTPISQSLCDFSFDILEKTQTEQALTANQKKIFMSTVQKVLQIQISLHFKLSQAPESIISSAYKTRFDSWCTRQFQSIIFHKDHIPELGQMLIDCHKRRTNSKDAQSDTSLVEKEIVRSYSHALLGSIEAMMHSNNLDRRAAIEEIPNLFQCFCVSFIEHEKLALRSVVIFSLFEQFYDLLSSNKQLATALLSKQDLNLLSRLSGILLKNDAFRPTGDVESKNQRAFLVDIFDSLLKFAQTLPYQSELFSPVFSSWAQLIQLDFSIVADHISEIWQFVLFPADSCLDSAVEFAVLILNMFVKSRELDSLLSSVLTAFRLQTVAKNKHSRESSLLDSRFLTAFGKAVSSLLFAQFTTILRHLYAELIQHYNIATLLSTDNTTEPKTKRQKTALGFQSTLPILDAGLVTDLICICIKHTSAANASQDSILALHSGCFNDFILPAMNASKHYSNGNLSEFADHYLCPALKLHHVLINSSHAYWETHVSDKSISKIQKQSIRLISVSNDLQERMAVLVCAHICRTVGISAAPSKEEGCRKIIHKLIDTIFSDTGELSMFSKNIITWQAILSNLFPICNVAHTEYVCRIVDALFLSVKSQPLYILLKNTKPCAGQLSAELLHHASFFEIASVRDQVTQSLFKCIFNCIHDAFKKGKYIKKGLEIAKNILNAQTSSLVNPMVISVMELVGPLDSPDDRSKRHIVVPESLNQASLLLDVLLKFPTTYFSLLEQDIIVAICFALDMIVGGTDAAYVDPESYLKWGRSSRHVSIRFMKSREGRLLPLLNPDVMTALIQLQISYDLCSTRCPDFAEFTRAASIDTGKTVRLVFYKLLETHLDLQDYSKSKSGVDYTEYLRQLCTALCQSNIPVMYAACAVDGLNKWTAHFNSQKGLTIATGLRPQFDGLVDRLYQEVMSSSLDHINAFPDQMSAITKELCQFFQTSSDKRFEKLISHIVNILSELDSGDEFDALRAILTSIVLVWVNDTTTLTTTIQVEFSVRFSQWLSDAWRLLENPQFTNIMKMSLSTYYTQVCSSTYFEHVFNQHLDSLSALVFSASWSSSSLKGKHLVGLLKSFKILFGSTVQAHTQSVVRHLIRSKAADILTMCIKLAETATCSNSLLSVLDLAQTIVIHHQIEHSLGNVSLVFSIVRAAGSNTEMLLGNKQAQWAVDAFDHIYGLLSSLLHHCRENVILLAPQLVACICALFDTFRETPAIALSGVRGKQRGLDQDQPSNGVSESRPNIFEVALDGSGLAMEPYRLFSGNTPLPVSCAKNLSRLLVSMTQKSQGYSSSNKKYKSKKMAETLFSQQSKLVRPFSKYAPFAISHIVLIQTSARPLAMGIKQELLEGIYALLDLCTDNGRNTVLASMSSLSYSFGNSDRSAAPFIFKEFVKGWETSYKYTGKT